MSSNKCARCEQTVYPVEGLRCLDKIWHKGCFKCHECNMTLNLKNYKGFEKRPYCNAHCPQAKATTVADTPEIRRLAENTRIQSQAKYHEDFEKSKGKGFTTVADDPEMRRIKETSKIISNVAYHGELEKKKQMEERRLHGDELSSTGTDSFNNNSKHHHNRMSLQQQQMINNHHQPQPHEIPDFFSPSHPNKLIVNANQQRQIQQQIHMQQQQQQLLLKQQKQQQDYLKSQNGQTNVNNRNSVQFDNQKQVMASRLQQPNYTSNLSPQQQHHQQQQMLMRQQQQQQQQILMQQQRQSIDPNMQPMNRPPPKHATVGVGNHPHHISKHQPINTAQAQSHQQPMMKYVPMGDAMGASQALPHVVNSNQGSGHMLDPPISNGHRISSGPSLIGVSPQTPTHHHPHHHPQIMYNSHHQMNGGNILPPLTKQPHHQQQIHMANVQSQQHLINHPNQMNSQQQQLRQISQHQMQQQLAAAPPPSSSSSIQQIPRRVFRAMYDYVANDVDEVTFYENDILIDCVNVDRNWLIGRVARTGQTGMLPANYVNELPT